MVPSFVIVGAGRAACALGRVLHSRGMHVTAVANRNLQRAQSAAEFIGVERFTNIDDVPHLAQHVLLAVSDDAITAVVAQLADAGLRNAIVLHTSGSRGPEALSPLADAGCSTGAMHPLQTLAAGEQGALALPGSYFAVTGNEAAVAWAAQIVELIPGKLLPVSPDKWALYHAAAVMASNYQMTLFDAALEIMEAVGLNREDGIAALAPIARATLENVLRLGPEAALTGPISRGDAETVRRNRAALLAVSPATQDLYRAAAVSTMAIAERRGLPREMLDKIAAVVFEKASEKASEENSL